MRLTAHTKTGATVCTWTVGSVNEITAHYLDSQSDALKNVIHGFSVERFGIVTILRDHGMRAHAYRFLDTKITPVEFMEVTPATMALVLREHYETLHSGSLGGVDVARGESPIEAFPYSNRHPA